MSNNIQLDITLNDKQYTVPVIGARQGLTVVRKLSSILLPTIGEGMDSMSDMALVSGKSISSIASTLVEQLDKADVEDLIFNILLKQVYCNGKLVNPDLHFARNYGEMVELLEFILKENFSSFFAAKGVMGYIKQLLPKLGEMNDK